MNFETEIVKMAREQGTEEAQHQLDLAMGTVNAMIKYFNNPDTFTFRLLKAVLLELEKCQRVLQQIRFYENH